MGEISPGFLVNMMLVHIHRYKEKVDGPLFAVHLVCEPTTIILAFGFYAAADHRCLSA